MKFSLTNAVAFFFDNIVRTVGFFFSYFSSLHLVVGAISAVCMFWRPTRRLVPCVIMRAIAFLLSPLASIVKLMIAGTHSLFLAFLDFLSSLSRPSFHFLLSDFSLSPLTCL
jgi:hypothetical protein